MTDNSPHASWVTHVHLRVWLLLLVALPLAVVGTFTAGRLAGILWEWHQMGHWREAPARIEHVRLERVPRAGSLADQVAVVYRYRVGSRFYRGTRLGLHQSADNLGGYHQRWSRELQSRLQAGTEVTCYVNPQRLTEAVLNRDLRPAKFAVRGYFLAVFGGLGYGLLFAVGAELWRLRRTLELTRRYPHQPWRWRSPWDRGLATCGSRSWALRATGLAVVWNLLALPVWVLLPAELRAQQWTSLAALAFPLVGLGLLVWALRRVGQWVRFGTSTFYLSPHPGIVGGPVAGAVWASSRLDPRAGLQVTLRCRQCLRRGITHREQRPFEQTLEVKAESPRRSGAPTVFPIYFAIPDTCPSSSSPLSSSPLSSSPLSSSPVESGTQSQVIWELEVKSLSEGPFPYHARFEVPVFVTEESSADFPHELAAEHVLTAKEPLVQAPV